jgi:hypothetical protein
VKGGVVAVSLSRTSRVFSQILRRYEASNDFGTKISIPPAKPPKQDATLDDGLANPVILPARSMLRVLVVPYSQLSRC